VGGAISGPRIPVRLPARSGTHNGFRFAACPLSGGLGNRVHDSCQ
jgi:hypothetical protein